MKPPKKRGGVFKWIALGVGGFIVLIIVIAAASGGGKSTATPVPAAGVAATTAAGTSVASVKDATATSAVTASATSAPTKAPVIAPTAVPAPAATTAASRAKVGDRTQVKTLVVTANQVVDPAPTSSFSKPKDGFRFVSVDFTVENLDTKPQSYNALYATVKDTDGRQYEDSFSNAETPAMSAGDNSAGDKIRGWVTFEVPVDAKLATFKYEPMLSGMQIVVDISK